VSAIGQLQREALEDVEGARTRPTTHPERYSDAGLPRTGLVIPSQDRHNEDGAGDVVRLAGFDANEPRDDRGRWTRGSAVIAPPGEKPAEGSEAGGPPASKKGGWDPSKVSKLITSTTTGKDVVPGLQSSRVMQSEKVASYYQERKTAAAPWPDSWKEERWGAMKDAPGGKTTLHVPGDYDTYQAARFLVHEGTHAMGKGEQDAYKAETQFALDLLKQNPGDKNARALLRPGMYKDGKGGLQVDEQGIADFLSSPAKSDYPAWEGKDPLKRFKQNASHNNIVDFGKEVEVKIK
jgi:hypothetical protein